ncbi:MAG: stimulus-sensing domain-containing protein [Alphaproteobacteria bacterium]|nr:stimulus-sensing domain-containing protein [Alphaproteobacteria bacterium]MBV8548622.1 stimulus-sensing domain-containing protein [Alphaproteobacteria bacterium]
MAWAIATARSKRRSESSAIAPTWWLWRDEEKGRGLLRRRRQLSPIVLRILAVNIMALAILVGSLLYLGNYQERIIDNELDALLLQSRIIASAVAENAVVIDENDKNILSPMLARLMVRRLAETTEIRTRLFDMDDAILADSRVMLNNKGKSVLPPAAVDNEKPIGSLTIQWISRLFDMIDLIHEKRDYPLYEEQEGTRIAHYDIVHKSLKGERATQVWRSTSGGLVLAASVPVQHARQVLGTVMMSRLDTNIDQAITSVRLDILKIFGVTLLITVMLSLYLARAIARPIRQLAQAAEGLRHGQMQQVGFAGMARLLDSEAIPDLTQRRDEIGDLSGALRDLTAALSQRVGAIENFAADVAHEIKNPLTSLRSAVETAERVQDPTAQRKLMAIISDDVNRLDRLISDISNASRLDAELSRDATVRVDIKQMLETLVDVYHHPSDKPAAEVVLKPLDGNLQVTGVEIRLVQVMQNLIDNAISFSPVDKPVFLSAWRDGHWVFLRVEDSGPGIPPNKLTAIFDRFYSERPRTEKFGTHSGLGLSISKQIVEAHHGRIVAENRRDAQGQVVGAWFTVALPAIVVDVAD